MKDTKKRQIASVAPDMHLFGGLVVVLGSVAFTLVNMVCFYCKFSGHFENMEGGGDMARDSTLGEGAAPTAATLEMEDTLVLRSWINWPCRCLVGSLLRDGGINDGGCYGGRTPAWQKGHRRRLLNMKDDSDHGCGGWMVVADGRVQNSMKVC
ncbi:Unknown protein, partial [Striga hermonthica]